MTDGWRWEGLKINDDINRKLFQNRSLSQVLYPGEDDGWQVYGSVQGKCVCSILTPVQSVCSGDPRYIRLRQTSDHVSISPLLLFLSTLFKVCVCIYKTCMSCVCVC